MPATDSRRSARIFGWALMALSMLLLLGTVFGGLRSGVFVPIAMMFLIFSIIVLGKAKSEEEARK